jgi:hypothetical protein
VPISQVRQRAILQLSWNRPQMRTPFPPKRGGAFLSARASGEFSATRTGIGATQIRERRAAPPAPLPLGVCRDLILGFLARHVSSA